MAKILTIPEAWAHRRDFSKKLKDMLNLSQLNWDDAKHDNLPAGKKINQADLLFTKIEDNEIEEQINNLKK